MKKFFSLFCVIFMLCFPLSLWAKSALVLDKSGVLSQSQVSSLEQKCYSLAQNYNCGIYIGIVPDMSDNNRTYPDARGIQAYGQYFFDKYCHGYGEDGDGILLVMSMEGRDYDLTAHGSYGHYAFTDYGKAQLENSFLSYFKNDRWYEGFSSYVDELDRFLYTASQGDPIDIPAGQNAGSLPRAILIGLAAGIIVALIVCLSMKASMKSVHLAVFANSFLTKDALKIASKSDVFTHTTVVHQKRENSSSSGRGGTTVNSSGFSHRSGKF